MQKTLTVIWGICLIFLAFCQAEATPVYQTRVKVIHGSMEPGGADPAVRDAVREIGPVFKYTRFTLIRQEQLTLPQGQPGRVPLPGHRELIITPVGTKGDRIQYQIRIDDRGRPVFQTGVLLRNHHSVTIGGPRFNKGVLLFNINGSTP